MGEVQLWDGLPLIDNGKIAIDEECCCFGVDCPCCSGGTPKNVILTLAGVGDGAEVECEDCDDWNDSFEIPQYSEDSCTWRAGYVGNDGMGTGIPWDEAPLPCEAYVLITLSCGPWGVAVDLTITLGGVGGGWDWKIQLPPPATQIDCMNMGVMDSFGGNPNNCDWTTATATLST